MSLKTEIRKGHELFLAKYGLDLIQAEQGSAEWLTAKLGVLSASNAEAILAGEKTATRQTYMAELVAQIATGQVNELSAAALTWGKENEDAARAAYEFETGETIETYSFIFKDDSFRVGISADGIFADKKGVEIKCPFASKNYVEFLTCDKIKPEWQKQCQFSMWSLGVDEWEFCQFDPRMKKNPFRRVTINKDPEMMEKFDEAVPKFIEDMNKMLDRAGFKFGDQWERLKLSSKEKTSA